MDILLNLSPAASAILYLVAAVSYALTLKRSGPWFLFAFLASALWSRLAGIHPVFDFLFAAAWSGTLLIVTGHVRNAALWLVPLASILGAVASVMWGPVTVPYLYYLYIFCCIGTLLLIEQLVRTRTGQARGIGLAIGALFLFNIYLYASGIFNNQISVGLLQSRHLANLCVALLLLIPLFLRTEDRTREMGMPRQAAFTTTSLALAGFVLLDVAVVGYLFRLGGGVYGDVLQHFIPFLIALCIGLYLSSASRRAWIRVWINKNFFKSKYDYTSEWRKLIERLSRDAGASDYERVALEAVLPILGAWSGALYLREGNRFVARQQVDIDARLPDIEVDGNEGFVDVLSANWIFTPSSTDSGLSRHNDTIPGAFDDVSDLIVILPLQGSESVLGFVLICGESVRVEEFDWEDIDLLRMVAMQISSFVGYQMLNEQAVVARQFEAFHHFTAFVMHDLKNLVAQQALVVDNATRFIDKPEFVRDAIDTIDNSVKRMERMIRKLQGSMEHHADHPDRVALSKVVDEAVSRCAAAKPLPHIEHAGDELLVEADYENLVMAVTHLVKNAQDACNGGDGEVEVVLSRDAGHACCEIRDTGSGMDPEFVRTRLFKPFDSTKATRGMGIGAFQCRQIVERIGGRLSVESESGKGTTMTVRIPLLNVNERSDVVA